MKINMGGLDRVLRILAGVVVLSAGVYYQNYWGAVGLLPLLTGVIGSCPAYMPFGLSTCRVKEK
ncbi:MAG: DUF2892 domain-containing protein [Gammaproteobacteria bacterium]|nr:DUF2892 domain-containing protein [Gammaproteobacteria bacterium]